MAKLLQVSRLVHFALETTQGALDRLAITNRDFDLDGKFRGWTRVCSDICEISDSNELGIGVPVDTTSSTLSTAITDNQLVAVIAFF